MKGRETESAEKLANDSPGGAIMRHSTQPPSTGAVTPNPFDYVLKWDRVQRKGQRCRIVTPANSKTWLSRVVLVEFEDGFTRTVDRRALRRICDVAQR